MSQASQHPTEEHSDRAAVVPFPSDRKNLPEDSDDLAVAAERRDEPVISHDDFLVGLKRDNLL